MANIRYFADINGVTVQLDRVRHDGSSFTSAKHFSGLTPDGELVACTRKIERKSNPSMHKCDGRCTSAKGFRCECECGGKNHGAGNMICGAA